MFLPVAAGTRMKHKLERLERSIETACAHLSRCELCPRRCGVDRARGEAGFCRAGSTPTVHNYFPHFGEEPPVSGSRGSGTIFFTHCTMRCMYCQNFEFSQLSDEKKVSVEELARMMLSLQESGCHNLNLVTPTHFLPQILEALRAAISRGFALPIVYNTSGYERIETLALLDGIVDMYLPDMRYAENQFARELSDAVDYVEVNRSAIKAMFAQVGALRMDTAGIATGGMIIRHLVLPNGAASSEETFRFIAREISPDTYVSVMSQYYPAYRASENKIIGRGITQEEYDRAIGAFSVAGLHNGWIQELSGKDARVPRGTDIERMR